MKVCVVCWWWHVVLKDEFVLIISHIRKIKPAAKIVASQFDKKTLKKRITNIEQGIMNVEVRYSIDLYQSEIVRATCRVVAEGEA
jgi:hypothetical protein